MKSIFLNGIILLVSIFVTLIAAEFLVRISVDPVNYLKPKLESDSILGHRIVPESGGHDSWGFRNITVPEVTDILAIGDSQTYGVMAPADQSWPARLAQLTKKNVYNLSLGGYGPVQYLHLLKEKSKKLNPKKAVIGIYLGNDLIDSYRLVYSNKNWSEFRLKTFKNQQEEDASNVSIESSNISLRQRLAYNSVIYRMITASSIGDMIRLWETKKEKVKNINDKFFAKIESSNINIGLTPKQRLIGLDLSEKEVQEGLRISLLALKKINDYTKKNKIKLLVVIIPTKESVYADLLEKTSGFNNPLYNKLITNESKVTNYLIAFLNNNKINFVEPIYAMRKAVINEAIYPAGFDGHPNGKGYAIIANEIKENVEFNKN